MSTTLDSSHKIGGITLKSLKQKEAVISGWDSQSSLRHIHCPKCGKIITYAP